jgi:hypothetical protein
MTGCRTGIDMSGIALVCTLALTLVLGIRAAGARVIYDIDGQPLPQECMPMIMNEEGIIRFTKRELKECRLKQEREIRCMARYNSPRRCFRG